MKRKRLILPILLVMIALPIITVEAQDPSVQIYDNLTDGQICSGIVNIVITAYHPDGIQGIGLSTLEIGHIYSISDSAHMDYNWDTTEYEDGNWTLKIIAYSLWPDGIQYSNWVHYSIVIDNIPDTTTDITTTSSSTEPDTGEPLGLSFDPILIGIVGGIGLISAVLVKRSMDGAKKVASDAKVLIICPYCGSKTEQGITKCQKCGADL